MQIFEEKLVSLARKYIEEEPIEEYQNQIRDLINNKANLELSDRLNRDLSFGTAGIRAQMEAGYNRMNLVSVFRFAYRLANYIKKSCAKESLVIIGFDARKNSENFAKEIASVLYVFAIKVYLFKDMIPTPLCAFASKEYKAEFGLMMTASHNPAKDNGIKIFDKTSAQYDKEFLNKLINIPLTIPSRNHFFQDIDKSYGDVVDQNIIEHYFDTIDRQKFFNKEELDLDISAIYTPIHGVGKLYFLKALKRAGFNNIKVVPEQAEPDPLFYTVIFPNPEEESALLLARNMAERQNIPLILAHDPDADRFMASIKENDDGFKNLSGNELGVIFGFFAIKKALLKGIKPLVISTIVSSRMLKELARCMGANYIDTLTGFSNIAKVIKIEKDKNQFVFAYEEAIGFLIGDTVLDKDGILAGLRFLEIASFLKKQKRNVLDFLNELYLKFGLFVQHQWSLAISSIDTPNERKKVMAKIRDMQLHHMGMLLGVLDVSKMDLSLTLKEKGPYMNLHEDVLIFEGGNVRLLVRPSGTEPKIKFYLEINEMAKNELEIREKKEFLTAKLKHIEKELNKYLLK